MKTTLAYILFLGGTALMLFGFIMAVVQFAGVYSAALKDGMAEGPDPKQVSTSMLTYAIIGGVGVIPATIGSILLGKGILARIAKKLQKPDQPAQ